MISFWDSFLRNPQNPLQSIGKYIEKMFVVCGILQNFTFASGTLNEHSLCLSDKNVIPRDVGLHVNKAIIMLHILPS